MFIRNLNDIKKSDRNVIGLAFESARFLIASDGMGYTFAVTTIKAGAEMNIQYRNHKESCYCIAGRGSIVDCARNIEYPLHPGVLYVLDKNDKHILKCSEEMTLMTVFNPPLKGKEIHDANGSYSLEAAEIV